MKKYAAFLRGINVSGKSRISMAELKDELVKAGFSEVSTYLNSGNIVFAAENRPERSTIRELIKNRFSLDIPVYITDIETLTRILEHAPDWWNTKDKGRYDNLIFILSEDSPEDICRSIGDPSEGLEDIMVYDKVIFWTFDRKLYQKCNWWKKTASKGITEKLTIRTAGTILKVCSM